MSGISGIRPITVVGYGDRTPRPPRPRGFKRLFCLDALPRLRVWMTGPSWRRLFDVRQVSLEAISPAAAAYHPAAKHVLLFTFEDDVRERVLEELRPGVYAQWSDPRERWAPREQSSDRSRRRGADHWERRLPRSARSVSSPDGRLMTAHATEPLQ